MALSFFLATILVAIYSALSAHFAWITQDTIISYLLIALVVNEIIKEFK